MDLKLYKNSWGIYRASFGKLFSFILAIVIVFIASFASLFITLGYDFGLLSINICAFVLVPLFFSFQIVIAKVSSGKKLNYNDLYSHYRSYFAPFNRGVYSVITNSFIALIVSFVFIYLSTCVYEVTHKVIFDEAMTSLSSINYFTSYQTYIDTIINLPDYLYFLLVPFAFSFLFFFRQIKKSFLIPYFSMITGSPVLINKRINKTLLQENKKFIRKNTAFGNLMFTLAFLIGFILTGVIILLVEVDTMTIEFWIIFSLFGGMIISSFLIPPLMINYCFIADMLQPKYMVLFKKQIINLTTSLNSSLDDETSTKLKDILDSLNKTDSKDNNDDSADKK